MLNSSTTDDGVVVGGGHGLWAVGDAGNNSVDAPSLRDTNG